MPGLPSSHPLAASLPGLYADDDFVQRFCAGLDDVLAPVLLTLDNLAAHFDPRTAPADFLPWLATWAGLSLDGVHGLDRQRDLLRRGARLHQWRGTVRGVEDAVSAVFGVVPDVVDSGGSVASSDPDTPPPGRSQPGLVVTLHLARPVRQDLDRLHAVVAAVKPAHVPHRVEIPPLTSS